MSNTKLIIEPKKIVVAVRERFAGFARNAVRGGGDVNVEVRGFYTSDDGPLLYTYLDGLFAVFARSLQEAGVPLEAIGNCLINVVDGNTATLWVNQPVGLQVIPKRAIQAGEEVTLDDIADIRDLNLGIELPTKGAIAYTFLHGFRRGLYFDFPIGNDDVNRPLTDLEAALGSCHAALVLRERIRMDPDVLKRMFATGWFPFARLPHDLVMELYRDLENNWDHADTEAKIVAAVSASAESWVESWSRKPPFSNHMAALKAGAAHFAKGEFMAASALLLPKVEGIMRSIHVGSGRPNAHDLRRNLLARVRADVSGHTALLPEAFVEYLESYFFAGFDLASQNVPPSRNAFMHGVGPDAETAKPAFPLRLLLMLDQLFFYL